MELLDVLNKGWFGVLFGLAVGWIFYRRSLRDPKISYQRKTTTLIGAIPISLQDRVRITYEGAPISDLHVTRLLVWNSGTAVVRKDSFPEGDQLLLTSKDNNKLLGVDIRKTSRNSNYVQLSPVSNGYDIEISYLNPGDAFIVDVLHRAGAEPVTLDGVILGQRHGVSFDGALDGDEAAGRIYRSKLRLLGDIFLFTGGGLVAVFIAYGYLMRFLNGESYNGMTPYGQLLGAILLSLFGIAGLLAAVLVSLQKGGSTRPRIELVD